MSRGTHEPYDGPVVPPRVPGETALERIYRICKANGWDVPKPSQIAGMSTDKRSVTERIDAIFSPPTEPTEPGSEG